MHEGHEEITDADMADLLKRVQARHEAAIKDAQARDSRICMRCVRLGGIIGQILWAETMLGELDSPMLHAALQNLYLMRDATLDHRSEPAVVQ